MQSRFRFLLGEAKNSVCGDKGLVGGFVLLAVALLAVLWWGTLSRVAHEKSLAIEGSIADSKNVASIVAANLDEVLGRAVLYARIGRALVEGDQSASRYLNPLLTGDTAYLRVAVFDANGRLLHSSADRQSEPEFAPLLKAAMLAVPTSNVATQLLIGRPTAARSAWRVPILIPFAGAEHPSGFFAAIVDLGYFLRLYKEVNLGEGGGIEIVTRDGFQLVALSDATLSAGIDYGGSRYAAVLASGMAEDVIDIAKPGVPTPQLSVVRTLKHYPLSIIVSRGPDYLTGKLLTRQHEYIWRTSFVSLVLLAFIFGLIVIAHRQRRLYNVLMDSEQEKLSLIVQLEQEKSRAVLQASHDYLTGIPNRMLFYELAAAELARAKRSRKLYALFFLDLDKFKLINDTLGHAVGDRLLQNVAKRLRESLREYDLLARLGGDEFVMLVAEMASEEDVARIAAKLVDVIRAPLIDLDGSDVDTSPSIGIALYPRDGQNVETLLTHADAAMYCAKMAGAATYRFFDASLNASSARDVELLTRCKRAIKDGEFRLHYQPRVELQDFNMVGLEALVRWQHPEHGLIFPNDFIPLFEENDLIASLGHWVIDTACHQIATWRKQCLPLIPVAINVSARQLKDDALLKTVTDALATHKIPAGLLEIEVTESCVIDDFEAVNRRLENLREIGIRIALDDYGTGFSGLNNLKKLPIYALKIDRSFIRDIRNDNSDAMIVASTIALAHNLGLQVVAEGVESKEQLVHLKTAGCDQIQGFYLQRPVAPKEIEPLLQRGKFTPS